MVAFTTTGLTVQSVKWNDRWQTPHPPSYWCVMVYWDASAGDCADQWSGHCSPDPNPNMVTGSSLASRDGMAVHRTTAVAVEPVLPGGWQCCWHLRRLFWDPYLIHQAYPQEELSQNCSELRDQVKLHNFTQVGVVHWRVCFELVGEAESQVSSGTPSFLQLFSRCAHLSLNYGTLEHCCLLKLILAGQSGIWLKWEDCKFLARLGSTARLMQTERGWSSVGRAFA